MSGVFPVDLHLHTTASDGLLSPREIVFLARRSRLSAIAITDHDTIAGVDEAQATGKEIGVEVISGVEVSVDSKEGSMHIVGLLIDHRDPGLVSWLEEVRRSRLERYPKIVRKLKSLGIDISTDEVEKEAGESVIGRPHIARVLKKKGMVESMEDAFRRYLGSGGKAYVSRLRVSSAEAIAMIHQSGGLAVLAHYTTCYSGESKAQLRQLMERLRQEGLDGIETYYHSFTPDEHFNAVELARAFGFLQSGGSDFHGPLRAGFYLGKKLSVPRRLLEELKQARKAKA